MKLALKIVLFLACAAVVTPARAWVCRSCHDSRIWPEDAKCCGNCGAKKPLPIPKRAPARPAPASAPPKYTQSTATYVPAEPAYAQPEPQWERQEQRIYNTPFHLGLWGSYVAIPPGENYSVYGVSANLIATVVENVYGIQVAYAFSVVKREMYGLQIGLAALSNDMCGLQIGPLVAYAEKHADVLQLAGVFAFAGTSMSGAQLAAFTRTEDLHGVQIGVWNVATTASGMQIGAINYADSMSGIQIGAINIIKNSAVPFFPVVNMHF